ncbi:putative O-glycosylation ligase, exosortase A system-associated [Rheinheimera sp. YQF-2]|uniref:Putative O-glycosylation ligase, exosortase A system-associated n=1 Tax=Rheinheimera lutimaris TaxID=2740584 RepID=A0A7Y5EKE3_9GAMM|nr:putative O-glycosylation ligase, exosortase A system-associated [Rheinheimera lutimaris]NRQ42013.1 putative O-glycosylation ligase, exosortase A system-associated [Rheinheimera lutimaris]
MRDIILLLIIMGSLPFILKRPFIGVLMWCWIAYMVPHRLAWGFMQYFPVASIVGGTFLLAYLFSKEPKKLPFAMPVVFMVLLNVWMIITFSANVQDSHTIMMLDKVLKIQLFTLVILAMFTTKQRIEAALWVVGLSIAFYGLKGGIYTIQTGGSGRVWGPTGGFFYGNNELALTLLVNLPILYYLRTRVPPKYPWLKWLILAAMALSVLAALGTQSRGGLVACVCVAAFLWLKSPHKIALLLVFCLSVPVIYQFMPDTWHQRMATIIEPDRDSYDGSVQGRFNAWEMSYNMAKENVFGGGFNGFKPANFLLYAPNPNRVDGAHSIYFQMIGHHGFIGLALFLGIFIFTWFSANNIIKMAGKDPNWQWASLLARMLQCSLIAFGSGGAFLGLAYFDLPYHLAITIIAVEQLLKKHHAAIAAEKKAARNSANVVQGAFTK